MPDEVRPLKILPVWLSLVLFVLSACAAPLSTPGVPLPTSTRQGVRPPEGAASPSPVPSPQPLRVEIDPAFEPLKPLMAGCVPSGLALYYVRPGQPADLSLSWGKPKDPAGPVFTLGSEVLVLIVHPSNSLASLSLAVLQQVYAGKYTNWDPLGGKNLALSAWAYPEGDAIQDVFEESLFQPEGLSSQVHLAPGPRELRTAVAADPGGLGFLPRRWLDDSVRVLDVPDTDSPTLTRPLLAAASAQPQGRVKDFLLCLQEGLKTQ